MFVPEFPKNEITYYDADIDFIRTIVNDTWNLDRSHVTDDYDESIRRLARHIDFQTEEYS